MSPLPPPDASFATAVRSAVTEVERTTDAEIVVVVARRSGSYADVPLLVGIGAGLVALIGLLFLPWDFPAWSVAPIVLAVAIGAGLLGGRSDAVARAVTIAPRRTHQVSLAAAATFHREAVSGTRNRTGILVYASRMERLITVVPDAGVTSRAAPGALEAVLGGAVAPLPVTEAAFVATLRRLGALLAEKLPATGDNPDELPNDTRFLS